MVKHVFGMAKSPLVLKGAIPRSLELDFLRLVYAVEHVRASGDEAIGYIAVLTEAIQKRINRWIDKYDAGNCVCVLVVSVDAENRKILEIEKDCNRRGNQKGAEPSLASASFGGKLAEDALRTQICKDFPGISDLTNTDAPLKIRWDFYGILQ